MRVVSVSMAVNSTKPSPDARTEVEMAPAFHPAVPPLLRREVPEMATSPESVQTKSANTMSAREPPTLSNDVSTFKG